MSSFSRRRILGSAIALLALRGAGLARAENRSVATLPDFSALRALAAADPAAEGGLVFIERRDASLAYVDQGAGWFRLLAAGAAAADNGGTLLLDAAGRPWARVTDGPDLFAGWFGADAHASDNAPFITAALAALPPEGGLVRLPDGRLVCSQIGLRSNAGIAGSGIDACTLVSPDGWNGYGLLGVDVRNVRISRLTLDGNKTGNPKSGMGLRFEGGSSDNVVSELRAANWRQDGIAVVGDGKRNQIVDCVVEDNGNDGVSFTGTTWNRVSGCRIAANGRFGIVFGAGADNSNASNNQCDGNGADQISAVNCADIVADGNICSNGFAASLGIQFNTVTRGIISNNEGYRNAISGLGCYMCSHVTVTGNLSYANGVRGIEIDSASSECVVEGNIVYRNAEAGITVYRSPGTIVSGNHATENGTGGKAPFGIRVWDDVGDAPSSNCVLAANICTDTRGAAATQTFGISIEGAHISGILLQGNILIPNRDGAVSAAPGAIAEADGNLGFSLN